jgi:hypothetical protein
MNDPYIFMSLVILETAHVVSPFVLSGANRGFRGVLREHWKEYLIGPFVVFVVFMTLGTVVLTIPNLILIYLLFNQWHFSMQNFGILQLMFRNSRRANFLCAFFVTAAGLTFAPLLTQVHHWVSDIGLSRRAAGKGWVLYLALIIVLAPLAILWNKTPWVTFGWQPPAFVIDMAKTLLVFRYSLSFAHFAISAKIWRFGDPRVRATIGKELFA